MEFVKGYMDDPYLRHKLNDMTGEIFGFSFEDWYADGHFEGEYIPYSYFENGRIVANSSANIMKMVQNGEEKLYIQIGTVMTREEYRNRGLARELIERILKDYAETTDGFYLFGNLNAVGFYEQLGFRQLNQWRYSLPMSVPAKKDKAPFAKVGERHKPQYLVALQNAVANTVFDHLNRSSLQLFYTKDMTDVYFCDEINCFAVMNIEDETLYLDSVISPSIITVRDVLERIDQSYANVILGFTPREEDMQLLSADVFDGGEDYRLFYIGEILEKIETDKLYFPVMSHA